MRPVAPMRYLTVMLGVLGAFFGSGSAQCSTAEDFGIIYNGASPFFSVSQKNGSCMCPGGFSGPGTDVNITSNPTILSQATSLANHTASLATQAGQILSMQGSIGSLQSGMTGVQASLGSLQANLSITQNSLSSLQSTVNTYTAAKSCPGGSSISAIGTNGAASCSSFSKLTWLATPIVYEYGFAGGLGVQLGIPGIVGQGYTAILANVFYTCSAADHQNIALGNGCTASLTNYLGSRGAQPSTQFAAGQNRKCVMLTYFGDADSFSSFYGIWYGNQIIPLRSDGQFDFSNWGNNGNPGWIYFVVLGYFQY
eukprot:TRINITY_DN12457_c0_g1_i1.p1 TRINITY_DN12457_c0_g1~~TRINITY_DN12457_c0_g1_i1.p1  ORF type:complete len:311 (+),score=-20.69 TRINITY_DN12457_c0_g1_i1:53-985(+)